MIQIYIHIVVVQWLSHVRLFVTPWTAACWASLSFTISQSLLKLMSIESTMPSNHLILCFPRLLLPSIFPNIRVFSSELALGIGGQNFGASASASVLPLNVQGWFPLGLTSLICLPSKELSKVFSSTTVQKHQFFGAQPSLCSNFHIHTWLLEKQQPWLYGSLLAKWCPWFLIWCLGLSQLFSQGANVFNFMAAITICSDFGAQENKICNCFHWSEVKLTQSCPTLYEPMDCSLPGSSVHGIL